LGEKYTRYTKSSGQGTFGYDNERMGDGRMKEFENVPI